MKNKFLTLIFALILLLPALDSLFHFSPVKELFEKRLPVAKPQFSFTKDYPRNFEKFFDDNYGFRKTLIAINADIADDIFDESPDARAVIGKDGWLYFDNHDSLLDATGRAVLSDKLVERGVESFARNWQEMRKKNIKYLLVIAADKSSVYPEFLPDYIKPSEPHRIDKFLNALKKKYPDFPVLDLRPILKKAKEKEIVYQKTDTHWNRRGAHYSYVEIMKMLGIKPHFRDEFINTEGGLIRGDISEIMSSDAMNVNFELEPKFPVTFEYALTQHSPREEFVKQKMDRFYNPTVYRNSNKNLPVAFVYKDSFFGDLAAFTAEHFSMLFSANEFPCDLDYEIIKNFHPNVVIQEFWEGRVGVVLSECRS